jgi:hypothetical protein
MTDIFVTIITKLTDLRLKTVYNYTFPVTRKLLHFNLLKFKLHTSAQLHVTYKLIDPQHSIIFSSRHNSQLCPGIWTGSLVSYLTLNVFRSVIWWVPWCSRCPLWIESLHKQMQLTTMRNNLNSSRPVLIKHIYNNHWIYSCYKK